MEVPQDIMDVNIEWDAQAANTSIILTSAIPQECFG